jgi:putative ABC transport system permease protein
MDTLLKDLRFAVRGLRRTPGFTIAAILALALGIGATTAIFSVVHAVLMQSLGWGEESRLIAISDSYKGRGFEGGTLSPPEVFDLRALPLFEQSGGFNSSTAGLLGEVAERVKVANVTAGFFEALGVHPVLGRTWTPEEDLKGKSGVALVSASAWRQRFASDPAAIGRSVTLDGESYRIIGVLPEGFAYSGPHEFWTPFSFPPEKLADLRGAHWLEAVARLKPGVSLEAARAALKDLAGRLREQYPKYYPKEDDWDHAAQPLRDRWTGSVKQPILILFGAVLLVLLIACANVANLLLARSAAREREFALRAAIGASRSRLVRQLLTEGMVMALAGMAIGVVLAAWGLDVLLAAAPPRVRELNDVRIDRAVLAFSIALTVVTALVFALAPALRASKVDVANALKDGAHGTSGSPAVRLRSLLVGGQVAISLFLLVGAGLMLRSFATVLQVSPGFDPEGVVTAEMIPSGPAYDDHPEALRRYYRDALRAAAALPGGRAVGGIDMLPVTGARYQLSYFIEGYEAAPGEPQPTNQIRSPLPGYFAAMRQPIVAGREFTPADDDKAPQVAMVNEAWVRRYFPGKDVVGRRIRLDTTRRGRGEWRTIVGVVADAREFGLDKPAPPVYYFCALQFDPEQMTVVVRGSSAADLRSALAPIDPTQPLYRVRPFGDITSASLQARRFPLQLLGVFAALALILSALGIYGVTSYAVAQRTREIGLRIAIGASPGEVVRLVLTASLRVVLAGLATGALAAIAGSRVLASQLYGISARDPLTLIAITSLLALVAAVASGIPALRAARIDPMNALRTE